MENNKLDYDSFAPLFGKWAEKFKPFIESKEMWDIYQTLKKQSQTETIVPFADKTFRAFQTTDPDNIKVIFYLMDPYPRMYKGKIPQATGIALDCSSSPDGILQPSLQKFYEGMESDLEKKVIHVPNLEYLHEQGIMLLNTDLTCKLNKTASHTGLWEPFQKYFLQEIMGGYSGIIYVLCGKASKKMRRYIYEMGNYVFEVDHPAAASHNRTDWETNGIFKKIDNLLSENGWSIEWNQLEYDSCPF